MIKIVCKQKHLHTCILNKEIHARFTKSNIKIQKREQDVVQRFSNQVLNDRIIHAHSLTPPHFSKALLGSFKLY